MNKEKVNEDWFAQEEQRSKRSSMGLVMWLIVVASGTLCGLGYVAIRLTS
jgi:hypothetical protein